MPPGRITGSAPQLAEPSSLAGAAERARRCRCSLLTWPKVPFTSTANVTTPRHFLHF